MLLQVLADHEGCRSPLTHGAGHLFGAAGADIPRGVDAGDAGFKALVGGNEALPVQVQGVPDKVHVGVEADEDEDRSWRQLFNLSRCHAFDHH